MSPLGEPVHSLGCGCRVGQAGSIYAACPRIAEEYEDLRKLVRSGAMTVEAREDRKRLEGLLRKHISSSRTRDAYAARKAAQRGQE